MRRVPRLVLAAAVVVACAAFVGQAVAAPGSFVWTKTPDPSAGNDSLQSVRRWALGLRLRRRLGGRLP